jgi:hypothetical protein
MAQGTKPPEISPDEKWWWDGMSWRPIAHPGLVLMKRAPDWAVIAMLCWALLPVGIAILMFLIAPTYWGPMVLVQFLALWVVLLGPALLILLNPRQP